VGRPGDDNQYTLSGLASGTYTLTGQDASGCPIDTSVIVLPTAQLVADEPIDILDPSCAGLSDGSIQIIAIGGTSYETGPAYVYDWGEAYPDNTTNKLDGIPDGNYSVSIIDANGCLYDSIFNLVEPLPLEILYDTIPTECPGEQSGEIRNIEAIGGTWPLTIFVNDQELLSNNIENLGTGEYVITVIDNSRSACTITDTATINAVISSCLSAPNAFTPNGDGANDVWIIDEDEDGSNDMFLYPNAELTIFNRWGEIVYFSNNVAGEPWDGTYNGRDLPIDTYHYVLDLGNGDAPQKGNVTIIR
jgi:gliding motility-associated-like protein